MLVSVRIDNLNECSKLILFIVKRPDKLDISKGKEESKEKNFINDGTDVINKEIRDYYKSFNSY